RPFKEIPKSIDKIVYIMKPIKLTMGAVSFLILFLFYSCEIERIDPAVPVEDVEEPTLESPDSETDKGDDDDTVQDSTESDEDPAGGDQKLEVIGSGSGKLVIKDIENKRYSIKPGTYSSFHLENIKSTTLEG